MEREPVAVNCLSDNIEKLGLTDRCRVAEADVARFTRGRCYQPFDIIFVDPPYGQNRLAPTLKAIMRGGWLAAGGYLLAEAEDLLRFDAGFRPCGTCIGNRQKLRTNTDTAMHQPPNA